MTNTLITVIAITLLVAGCDVAQSPVAPSLPQPVFPSPPPAVTQAGPHFALEIRALNLTTYEGQPWMGQVSVIMNPTILRAEVPARVVTTCGGVSQAHALGSGSASFSCVLPVGVSSIGAVAEMGDGRRYPTAINATVIEAPIVSVPLYYDVPLSSRDWTDVTFGTQTFAEADYRWTFGDGETATTRLNGTEHRYEHPGDERAKERTASVRVVRRSDGRTLATGSVVGIW